jgi:hypothetical protein
MVSTIDTLCSTAIGLERAEKPIDPLKLAEARTEFEAILARCNARLRGTPREDSTDAGRSDDQS